MQRKALLIIIIIIMAGAALPALEIGTYFNIGNMSFLEKPLSELDPPATTFPSDELPWGVSLTGSQNVGEGLMVDFGYSMDPILKNLAYGTFTYTGEFFSMGAGPAFGVFNTTKTMMQPGISTNFRLELAGLAFVSFDLLSSIGDKMSTIGDYSQNNNTLSAGFYVPNAICSLNLVEKGYNEKIATYGEMQNTTIEYSFKSEIYKKNIPFRLLIGLIYRTTSNNYVKEEIVTTGFSDDDPPIITDTVISTLTDFTRIQTMNSIILQTKIDFALTSWLTMVLDVNSSIFNFGSLDNTDFGGTKEVLDFNDAALPDSYRFQASLGFRIDMDNLNNL